MDFGKTAGALEKAISGGAPTIFPSICVHESREDRTPELWGVMLRASAQSGCADLVPVMITKGKRVVSIEKEDSGIREETGVTAGELDDMLDQMEAEMWQATLRCLMKKQVKGGNPRSQTMFRTLHCPWCHEENGGERG